MSVAMGMPQPVSEPPAMTQLTTTKMPAGTIMPPSGRGRRDDGLAHLRERAEDELVLQLQPDDEEEDREQAVGRPDAQREVQVEGDRADLEVDEVEVRVAPTGSWPTPGRSPLR